MAVIPPKNRQKRSDGQRIQSREKVDREREEEDGGLARFEVSLGVDEMRIWFELRFN